MGARARLFEHPTVYSAWQAPFAREKFAPVERRLRGHESRRVLDVGCGTGTNAARFDGVDYVGVDINDRYLQVARRRFRGRFITADLTTYDVSMLGTFDTILVNSFLHHLPDADVARILARLAGMLTADGRVHILELVLPDQKSPAWFMARLDRGRFARPLPEWCALFSAAFEAAVIEPYTFGGNLWSMIYFQGGRKA
jgi:SAM-dependent methyltransferase